MKVMCHNDGFTEKVRQFFDVSRAGNPSHNSIASLVATAKATLAATETAQKALPKTSPSDQP